MAKVFSLFSLFRPFTNIEILLSEKKDGGMKIRYELEKDEETLKDRKQFFNQHDISEKQVVIARLAQDNKVAVVSQKDTGKYISKTDGLLTQQKEIFLSITVADCLPIYIYEPDKEVIGLLHAGWRGLDKNIIGNAIDSLSKTFTITPKKLIVGIGPGIDICHFAVQTDVLDKFSTYSHVSEKRDNEYFLNLKQIAKQQFLKNNIREEHIEINPLCTYCEKNSYFSYRRDKSNPLQAMVASIGMK